MLTGLEFDDMQRGIENSDGVGFAEADESQKGTIEERNPEQAIEDENAFSNA